MTRRDRQEILTRVFLEPPETLEGAAYLLRRVDPNETLPAVKLLEVTLDEKVLQLGRAPLVYLCRSRAILITEKPIEAKF